MDVELVCTHEQLADELGGADGGIARLAELTDGTEAISSEPVRRKALADVLRHLAKRTPPIHESAIDNPQDLQVAVIYGAYERMYREGMTTREDVYGVKQRMYDKRFSAEVQSMQPSVSGGHRAGSFCVAMERR